MALLIVAMCAAATASLSCQRIAKTTRSFY